MIWQDILIMVGCFAIGGALIPSIFSKAKPIRSTCLLSFIVVVGSFIVAFVALGLWASVGAQAFCALMWLILLFQRRKKG